MSFGKRKSTIPSLVDGVHQDGGVFYADPRAIKVADYSVLVRGPHDLAGMLAARERFVIEHPQYARTQDRG